MADTRGLEAHESGVGLFERFTPGVQAHSKGIESAAATGDRGGAREGRPSQSWVAVGG